MFYKHSLLGAALAGLLSVSAAISPLVQARTMDEIKASELTVVTEDNYAPFNFMDGDTPDGFVNDLLVDLKAYAPFPVTQDIIPWTGLLAAVSAGKYDLAFTGAIITPERLNSFDFTPPFASAQHFAIIRVSDKDKIKTVKDLDGLVVGVQAGSALLARLPELETMLEAEGGEMGEVVQYTSYPEAFADLANGRLDFVVDNYVSAKMLEKKRPDVFAVGVPVSGPGFLAFPMKKGNDGLMAFMVGFMDSVRDSGKLAELQKEWFGEAFPDLPVVPITSVEQYQELIKIN